MHLHFTDDRDIENVIIDSTILRAHPYAAGVSKETATKMPSPWDEVVTGSVPRSM
jgi:hypothetical protein